MCFSLNKINNKISRLRVNIDYLDTSNPIFVIVPRKQLHLNHLCIHADRGKIVPSTNQ